MHFGKKIENVIDGIQPYVQAFYLPRLAKAPLRGNLALQGMFPTVNPEGAITTVVGSPVVLLNL